MTTDEKIEKLTQALATLELERLEERSDWYGRCYRLVSEKWAAEDKLKALQEKGREADLHTRTLIASHREATDSAQARVRYLEGLLAGQGSELGWLREQTGVLQNILDCAEAWLDECTPVGNVELALAAAIKEGFVK